MARPKKNGLDTCAFSVDFFAGERMVAVCVECGAGAQLVAMHLLCTIYRQGYYARCTDLLVMNLAGACALTPDSVRRAVKALAKWGIFDSELFEKHGILTSLEIQSRYFEEKRRRAPASAPYLLAADAGVSAAETPAADTDSHKNPALDSDTSHQAAVKAAKTSAYAPQTPVFATKTADNHKNNNINNKNNNIIDIRNNNNDIKDNNIDSKKDKDKEKEKPGGKTAAKNTPEAIFKAMKTDADWGKSVCLSCKVAPYSLMAFISEFALHCTASGKRHRNLGEAKNHFCNWLRRRNATSCTSIPNTPTSNTYSNERNHNPHGNPNFNTGGNQGYAAAMRRGMPPEPRCGLIE